MGQPEARSRPASLPDPGQHCPLPACLAQGQPVTTGVSHLGVGGTGPSKSEPGNEVGGPAAAVQSHLFPLVSKDGSGEQDLSSLNRRGASGPSRSARDGRPHSKTGSSARPCPVSHSLAARLTSDLTEEGGHGEGPVSRVQSRGPVAAMSLEPEPGLTAGCRGWVPGCGHTWAGAAVPVLETAPRSPPRPQPQVRTGLLQGAALQEPRPESP